jgi:pyruvate dehydrogenase E2 component (dihydrolipoamide acetyltransferase)
VLLSGGGSTSKYEALANLRDPLAVARAGGAFPDDEAPPRANGNGAGPLRLPWPGAPGAAAANGANGAGGSPGGPRTPANGAAAAAANGAAAAANGAAAAAANGAAAVSLGVAEISAAISRAASDFKARTSSEAVLPLESIKEQMRLPHPAVGGRPDGSALLQDVIGAAVLQRLQQAKGEGHEAGGGAAGAAGEAAAAATAAATAAAQPPTQQQPGAHAAAPAPAAAAAAPPPAPQGGCCAGMPAPPAPAGADNAAEPPRPRWRWEQLPDGGRRRTNQPGIDE